MKPFKATSKMFTTDMQYFENLLIQFVKDFLNLH